MTGEPRAEDSIDRLRQDIRSGIRAMTSTAILCTVVSHVVLVAWAVFLVRTG